MVPILTDENFEKEIQGIDKPVLVDFFATWCGPCSVLTPILEKIAEDLEGKIILIKVDLDNIPLAAQKFGIDRIPTVVLFKSGKPVSGFVGLRAEGVIREWLENTIKENEKSTANPSSSADGKQEKIEEFIKEYEEYAQQNGFKLNPDRKVVERLVIGMLENEKKYGARYCPCKRITGNLEEDRLKICPCQFMRKEIEEQGHCFCGLFLKRDENEKPSS